jgi:hypothetical protein
VGIVYSVAYGNKLLHRLFFCRNGSTLTVDYMYYDHISASGCEHKGTYHISVDATTMNGVVTWTGLAIQAVSSVAKPKRTTNKLRAGADCSSSDQCQDGCCSSVESNGVAKCTPVEGGYNSDICIPSGSNGRYLRFVGMEENQPLN